MPPQPRITTYLGIFLVALATLMYEILLTRIFSVTMLYHFAFVALSVAMFGLTAGALVVYLAPHLFPPERLRHRLAGVAIALPIAMVLSFLIEMRIPFRVSTSLAAVSAMALTYLVVAVPFVVSGVAICLILTRYPSSMSRLYAADLAGAALGCVLLIGVLNWSDGPTAVLWVALLASIGAVAFAIDAGRAPSDASPSRQQFSSSSRPRGTRSWSGVAPGSSGSSTRKAWPRRVPSMRSGIRIPASG